MSRTATGRRRTARNVSPAAKSEWSPVQAASPGAAVFQTRGCMNCHSLHGTGGTFGPALDTIGRTLSKEQIEHYIRNPKAVNPKALMPPQTHAVGKRV